MVSHDKSLIYIYTIVTKILVLVENRHRMDTVTSLTKLWLAV